ncbi:GxxExxY protein [uncultured Sphingomonas sp.]|uniref:GxxExxY protein n=1 Tax=uncultured Sphingomonas sp. TaxID=158754 RepID=UPI0035CB8D4A
MRSDPVRRTLLDEGRRADLPIEDQLLIELKSIEGFVPVHGNQMLTCLRLTDKPLGLSMNFGAYTFKDVRQILSAERLRRWR